MSSLGGIVAWVTASLANSTNLNDFATPTTYLTFALSSLLQNGRSSHGVLPSPNLPFYLESGQTVGPPWGNRTVNGNNPYSDAPDTGITRTYDFTITRGIIAPDGVNKSSILINNQFPGVSFGNGLVKATLINHKPLIEANWGDHIEVTIHNEISNPEEGTTINWHGISQQNTPWYDGTPSISQCPIAPASNFTYNFQASVYGTSWYHSHYSAQYTGGLFGPMVIYGPSNLAYDFDLGPILLHDYYHTDYYKLIENTVGNDTLTALLTPSDNTLIQGKGNYDCTLLKEGAECTSNAGLAKFNLTTNRTHRLRLINSGSAATPMLFSIDNHTLTVLANDFTPIVPYDTNVVSLGTGQRVDVLVKATGPPAGAFWMRARQPDLCNFVLQPFGLAAIYYDGADTSSIPLSLPQEDFMKPIGNVCANDPLQNTVPAFPIAPNPNPSTTVNITVSLTINETGHTLYQMNGQSFRGNYNAPLLGLASQRNVSEYEPQWNVYDFGSNESVRIQFINLLPFAHPMHLHGQSMFVLAEGTGTWDGSVVRPENPQRRDTQILQANGYMVVQLTADNPGVWPFHCHIAWHLSAGMYINMMLKPESLTQREIPDTIAMTCDAWNQYTRDNTVDQIDSGLKRRWRDLAIS